VSGDYLCNIQGIGACKEPHTVNAVAESSVRPASNGGTRIQLSGGKTVVEEKTAHGHQFWRPNNIAEPVLGT
jgi:hypothetical protein